MPILQNQRYSFAAEKHYDETCDRLKPCIHDRATGGEKPAKSSQNGQNRGEYQKDLKVTRNSSQGGDLIFTGAGEIAFDAYKEWFVSWGPASKIKVCVHDITKHTYMVNVFPFFCSKVRNVYLWCGVEFTMNRYCLCTRCEDK